MSNALSRLIASGKVNGYFDTSKHTEEDGKTLLDNAVSPILDIKSELGLLVWLRLLTSRREETF